MAVRLGISNMPPSSIHQVIIIAGLNKLYDVCSRPEDALQSWPIGSISKTTRSEKENKKKIKLDDDMAIRSAIKIKMIPLLWDP